MAIRAINIAQSLIWAIDPRKLDAIFAFLAAHDAGLPASSSAHANEQNHGGFPYYAAIPGQTSNAVARQDGRVGVLPIRGVIAHRAGSLNEISGGTSTERADAVLQAMARDPSVKAIVLDIDSPGGTVAGTAEMAASVREAAKTKPVIAQVNAMAASAAYWIASQASDIAITPSGEVGSIGVLAMHMDDGPAYESAGLRRSIISAGKYKAEMFGALSDDARARVQADVDAMYKMFVADVAAGRGRDIADVRNGFGEGRMVLAADAVRMGMADRIATMEQTLNRYGASMHGAAPKAAARNAIAARHALRRAKVRSLERG